jgi:hypothetical protein
LSPRTYTGPADLEPLAALAGAGLLRVVGDAAQQIAQVEHLPAHVDFSLRDAGDVEQIVDQAPEVARLARQHVARALLDVVERFAPREQRQGRRDRCERVA